MPTDEIESFRIICEGGLNTNENSLILSQESPGSATTLLNFETHTPAGYRRINGYIPHNIPNPFVGGAGAEGKILGVWVFQNTGTGDTATFAARKKVGSSTYGIWKLSGTSWVAETIPVRNMAGVDKVRIEVLNFGSGNHLVLVDGGNSAMHYDGTTWTALAGNQITPAPNYIHVFKNHVFLAGDRTPSHTARVVHSAPNDPTKWNVADGAGQLFPGFDVVQIRSFRDELFIFGSEQIKKAIADVSAGFLIKDVTKELGCVASDSVLEIAGNLIFMSYDGIRSVAGTDRINDVELGLLSGDIQSITDNIVQLSNLAALDGVVIKKKTQFRYFYDDATAPVEASRGIIGSVRRNTRINRDWEFGELRGIRTSSCWSGLINGREVILHGDYDGAVYRQEVGSSFNGSNILSIYTTPFIDLGASDIRKLWRKITVFLSSENTMTGFMGINFDWHSTRTINPADYDIAGGSRNFVYNGGNEYNDGIIKYGTPSRGFIPMHIQGSSFAVQFTFVNDSQDDSFIIQTLIPEYSLKGRQ